MINAYEEFFSNLVGLMERVFLKELNGSHVEYAFTGFVTEINTENNTATVEIGELTTDFLPNCTGEILAGGDTVKVFSDKRNMMGAYIGVKLLSIPTEST